MAAKRTDTNSKDIKPPRLRRIARQLGFKNYRPNPETSLKRWYQKLRSLPENDPRHIPDYVKITDVDKLRRYRQTDLTYLTGTRALRKKKQILVDELHSMSNLAFEDRYRDSILSLLENPKTSRYHRRQLRQMQKDLGQGHTVSDTGQLAFPLDLWRRK